MIDLHSHILHGLDDGARSLAESVEMARAAVADGIGTVAATPHVRDDYPTTPTELEAALGELRAELEHAGIALQLLTGGEIALDRLDRLDAEERARFGLGGNPQALLLEFPYHGWPLGLAETVFGLRASGTRPVLAHPERNDVVRRNPSLLEPVVRAGALVQLTAASLDGRLGTATRSTAFKLLDLRLAHLVSSDAHSPDVRSIGLREAAEAVGSAPLAHWLTELVPKAIVAGSSLPPRPPSPQRGGRVARLLRRG